MGREASEIRPAPPFVGLDQFENALDGIDVEVTVDGDVIDSPNSGAVQLTAERLLRADYRLVVARDAVGISITKGIAAIGLPADAVSLLCFATSPTLKQTVLAYPVRGDGRVRLEPIQGPDGLPTEVPLDAASNSHLFHDVSSGFRITYGFVLGRNIDTTDALTPRWKGTWLARRSRPVQIVRERTGSYEIHELTDELRAEFGLRGRPLSYVRLVDDAISPLIATHLDEVVEIYVDADVLPLMRSERPGAATRFVASQVASQVYMTVLDVGARALDDEESGLAPERGSVFATALAFLNRGRGEPLDGNEIAEWLESDPGRLAACVQASIDQVSAAEALLAS